MARNALVVLIACMALAGGCRRTDAPSAAQGPDAATTPSPASATAQAAPAAPVRGLVADPAVVRTCDVRKGVRTTLRWDVSDSGAEKVVLYALSPKQTEEKPFGRGGPIGSKQSGPWLRPGMVFRLRDQASGKELASVTIEGQACR